MYFSDRDPMDMPRPPSVDDYAARFETALMTLVPQPSLSELAGGMMGSSSNGGPTVLDSVSISYTFWRVAGDHDDPANRADLSDSVRESLDTVPPRPLPDWLLEFRRLMRFPSIWEAVRTTRAQDVEWQTPESTLVDHANHILMNIFRDQRVVGGFPGELQYPVAGRNIQPAAILVDGVEVSGMQIDSDPDVYAVGADLGDRILTSVIPREYLPHMTVEFVTRSQ